MGGKVLDYEAKQILNKGVNLGISQGLSQGWNQCLTLSRLLLADNRSEDLMRATTDEAYRNELLLEYGISYD